MTTEPAPRPPRPVPQRVFPTAGIEDRPLLAVIIALPAVAIAAAGRTADAAGGSAGLLGRAVGAVLFSWVIAAVVTSTRGRGAKRKAFLVVLWIFALAALAGGASEAQERFESQSGNPPPAVAATPGPVM